MRVLYPLAICVSLMSSARGQELGGCPVLPKNNIWNTPIDGMPVEPLSAKYIETAGGAGGAGGAAKNLHPDFSEQGGIPFVVVPANQPRVPVTFKEALAESDPGPYPIPPNPPLEIGTDKHLLVLQQGECKLYELLEARPGANGGWEAYGGAVFDLRSNALRPDGWTSADAAGLPILPGLVRYDEILAGEIRHAIRMTVPNTRREYKWPGRHFASQSSNPLFMAMGQRLRLRANYDITKFDPKVQVLLRALKKYGTIIADNGSPWYITGQPDKRWDLETWAQVKRIVGADFEVVDVTSLMINPNSGQAGTVSTVGRNEVSFSSSPVFDGQGGTTQSLVLTGSVVSSSLVNLVDGQQLGFLICQNAMGGHTFVWPTNVRGATPVGTAPNTCTAQQFISDGKGLYAVAQGVADLQRLE